MSCLTEDEHDIVKNIQLRFGVNAAEIIRNIDGVVIYEKETK